MKSSPKLYICIISPDLSRDRAKLIAVARQFSHSIEVIEDGVVFDVSGLDRLIGKSDRVAKRVSKEMLQQRVPGSIGVAETVDSAKLLARQGDALQITIQSPEKFEQIPLDDLGIENDTLKVFKELGIRKINDLLVVPEDELIARYGKKFREQIDVIEQKGRSLITPNVKDESAAWNFALDNEVEDFEQLIFVANHGLEKLFTEVGRHGFSTEHLDIGFRLSDKSSCDYEIKTSFPTLDRPFWLKLINLRISLDPPQASITGVRIIAHFTKPRPNQRGLYAASKPEPESLLLTVGKLKKLVGEDNVGVPVLLNDRLAKPFDLDPGKMPAGREVIEVKTEQAVIALIYFRPPIPAEVLVRDGKLIYLRTRMFAGHILSASGMWRSNSHWWDKPWKTQEWDVEVETSGVFRLCKGNEEWVVVGEYD
jgi:protein ImuB